MGRSGLGTHTLDVRTQGQEPKEEAGAVVEAEGCASTGGTVSLERRGDVDSEREG